MRAVIRIFPWYDALGRKIREESYGLNKKKIMVDTEYNAKSQVYQVLEPPVRRSVLKMNALGSA